MNGFGNSGQVVRIHHQRAVTKLGGSSRKLADNHHALLVNLSRAEFFRHQVHSVFQRSNQSDIGSAIVAQQLFACEVAVNVVNGHPTGVGELAVDLTDQQLHFPAQGFVFLYVFPAGNDDQHKGDSVTNLRIAAQQDTKSLQALGNSLGVIHAVDAKQHEVIGELAAELVGCGFDVVTGGVVGEFLKSDADGECGNLGLVIVASDYVLNMLPFRRCSGKDSFDTTQEVEAVAVGLKSEKVVTQQAAEDIFAPWQFFKNIRAWKWDVREKLRRSCGAGFA